MQALTRLMQLSDSAFPAGAYAFSDGLEVYTQNKIVHDAVSLTALLQTQLRLGWGHCDAPACALAWKTDANLEELNEILSAIKIVESIRNSSFRVGAAFERAARNIWSDLEFHLPTQSHHAVAFGVIARALEIPQDQTVTAFVSSWLLGKATVCTRLFKIGGLETQKIVFNLETTILETVQFALSASLDDISSFAPALDLAARAQVDLKMRLFQS
jgi:urease accessory protein